LLFNYLLFIVIRTLSKNLDHDVNNIIYGIYIEIYNLITRTLKNSKNYPSAFHSSVSRKLTTLPIKLLYYFAMVVYL